MEIANSIVNHEKTHKKEFSSKINYSGFNKFPHFPNNDAEEMANFE